MPKPGQIICYKNYVFADHSRKDKLFVVVNDSDEDSICLALKTTSQSARYRAAIKGCNSQLKVFFVPNNWEQCFTLDTYIQLPEIFQFTPDELLVGDITNKIYVSSSLSVNGLNLLKNCLKQFQSDISLKHWQLIYKK